MPTITTRGAASVQGFAPLAARPSGPLLLMAHMNGTNGATTFVDSYERSSLVRVNSATLTDTDPKFGATCLSALGNDAVAAFMPQPIGLSDFTIEFWVKIVAGGPATQVIYDMRGDTAPNWLSTPVIYHDNAKFLYYVSDANRISGGTVVLNTWTAIAISRVAGTTSLYVGTARVGQWADTTNYVNTRAWLGGTPTIAGANMNGYLDEVRVNLIGHYSGATRVLQTAEFPNT